MHHSVDFWTVSAQFKYLHHAALSHVKEGAERSEQRWLAAGYFYGPTVNEELLCIST